MNPQQEPNGGTAMGLALLAGLSVAGVHSAVNPSYFTLRSFAAHPEARRKALEGLIIGLVASTATSVAIYGVFKKFVPALVAELTAVGLTAIGIYAIYSPPLLTIAQIEAQPEVAPARALEQPPMRMAA